MKEHDSQNLSSSPASQKKGALIPHPYTARAKNLFMYYIGFVTYIAIEVIYRGHSHWSMGIVGGLSFILIGALNSKCSYNFDLLLQMLLSTAIITALELISGLVLNRWLGLNIWDYSSLKYNFLGQISLHFSLIWFPLSMAAIFLDDWLRYYLFEESKPHYKLLGHKLGDWENCGCDD